MTKHHLPLLQATFNRMLSYFGHQLPDDGPSSFRVETNGDNRWWS